MRSGQAWEVKVEGGERAEEEEAKEAQRRKRRVDDPCVCVCCCASQWVSSALAPAGNASAKPRECTPVILHSAPFHERNTIHPQHI